MRSALGCALAVLSGCDLFFPLRDQVRDAPGLDDGAVDTPSVELCYGRGVLQLCLVSPPTAPFEAPPSGFLDTTFDSACVPYKLGDSLDSSLCVIAGTSITIDTLRAFGVRPLVLVSPTTITVNGSVDVSSTGVVRGAGASDLIGDMDCPDFIVQAGSKAGGAGGSFGKLGGNGTGTGSGRPPTILVMPSRLRGGCRGGGGGSPSANTFGVAGGAVALIATTISITGVINASGMGGRGGTGAAGGGGGGGSGGMILLDGTVKMDTNAALFANGGGGGEGAGNINGNDGCDGGESAGASASGSGGSEPGIGCGSLNGDNGGDGGSIGGSLTGASGVIDGDTTGGGGGGGGGVGVIHVFPAQVLAPGVSPPPG